MALQLAIRHDAEMRRGTCHLRPSPKGWLAFLAQFALVVAALVSFVVAVPQTGNAVDRLGWARAEGAVTRVEPLFDALGALGSLFGAGLPTPVAYEVTVSTADDRLTVVVPESPPIGQPLTVYFDPESRETTLESPWLPASKAAGAIAMTALLTAGWWLIERSSRRSPTRATQSSARQVVPQETRDSVLDAVSAGGPSKTGTRQSGRTLSWLPGTVFVALFITAFVFVRIGLSTDPAPLGVTGFVLTHVTAVALLVVSLARRRMIPALIAIAAMVVPVTAFYIGERLYGPCWFWCSESEDLFYAWGIPISLALQTLALLLVSRSTVRGRANP